ncbi:MAG: hypothetical protein ACEPOV_14820 [Hyphomicrobiales bacterium]
MKRIFSRPFFIVLIMLLSLKIQGAISDKEGVLIINFDYLHLNKQASVNFYDKEGEALAQIYFDRIILNQQNNISNSIIEDVFCDYFNCFFFDIEYSLVIINGLKRGDEFFTVFNDKEVYININESVSFQTLEKHVEENIISLTQESPLRILARDESEIIENYLDYDYEVIEVIGDWLKVKCFKDVYGLDFEGFVKWREDNKLLIKIIYSI